MSKNRLGLVLGSFLALFHAVWSLAVAIMPISLQGLIDWDLQLHHIDMPFIIVTPFVLANAIQLIILTFVIGYILGWVLGWLLKVVGCYCKK